MYSEISCRSSFPNFSMKMKIPCLPFTRALLETSANLIFTFATSRIRKKLPSSFALRMISPIILGLTLLFLDLIRISSSSDLICPAATSLLLEAIAPAIMSKVKLYLRRSSSVTSTEISRLG